MIHEYAVEPEAISTRDRLKLVISLFKQENGRLISRYPSRWESRVRHLVQASLEQEGAWSFQTQQWLTNRIQFQRCMVEANREYDMGRGSWLDNVTAEHFREPFEAVLVADKTPTKQGFTDFGEVDEYHDAIQIDEVNPVDRNPKKYGQILEPLLRISSRIVLVDPYFNFNTDDHCDTFLEIIEKSSKGVKPLTHLEIHMSMKSDSFKFRFFQETCKTRLLPMLPEGVSLNVFRWRNIPKMERMHDRFVITDVGGVAITGSLDGGEGQTTRFYRMTYDEWEGSKILYCPQSTTFEPADVDNHGNLLYVNMTGR